MKIKDLKGFEKIFFWGVLLFGISAFFANIIKIFIFPAVQTYKTVAFEMIPGVLLMFLPFVLAKFSHLVIPQTMRIFYWFFLFISVYLGTGYLVISHISFWDKILHATSPILLTGVGYGMIGMYLGKDEIKKINPNLFIVFGFAFAGTCGVFWEFWEFLCDSVANMNLQRYLLSNGTPLVGRAALMDTMGDLITNTIGALIITIFSVVKGRHMPGYFESFTFERLKKK
ncbi:hypothetical protein QUW13_02330 [Enterococcus hirae]|nr:hypothetical protein [Enterococcus hirae]